jgi:galactofuranose transport system ATP-binding protein
MSDVVLRMEGITKRFAGVTALDGVSLSLGRGEVHALVGENGAGKSTLVKIMTGAYRRDAGEMWLGGHPVAFDGPAAARGRGRRSRRRYGAGGGGSPGGPR